MNTTKCAVVGFARIALCLASLLAMGISGPAAAGQQGAARYVCTPCGLPCDAKFFDKPGNCPSCGMPLIPEEQAKAAAAGREDRRKVAILIFDGVQIVDFTGPYEFFGAAGFEVYTVAKKKNPITTSMGLTVVPRYSFDDVPKPDVLVVPGGGVKIAQDDSLTLAWIRTEAGQIEHTMSVCNGAFILAQAGLLDGLSATTTAGNIPRLRAGFPKIKVVSDKRYVDNGRILTSAGLSAGIDGALRVISVIMGQGVAEQVALSEEYDWHPGKPFVRASLADELIPIQDLPDELGRWTVERTAGNSDRWEFVLLGTTDKSVQELKEFFEGRCSSEGKWTRVNDASGGLSVWKFNGPGGKVWHATMSIAASPDKAKAYRVKMSLAKG